MTLNFFVSVMVYPMVGTLVDHFGFMSTFRGIALLGFLAVPVVLLTKNRLHRISIKSGRQD